MLSQIVRASGYSCTSGIPDPLDCSSPGTIRVQGNPYEAVLVFLGYRFQEINKVFVSSECNRPKEDNSGALLRPRQRRWEPMGYILAGRRPRDWTPALRLCIIVSAVPSHRWRLRCAPSRAQSPQSPFGPSSDPADCLQDLHAPPSFCSDPPQAEPVAVCKGKQGR